MLRVIFVLILLCLQKKIDFYSFLFIWENTLFLSVLAQVMQLRASNILLCMTCLISSKKQIALLRYCSQRSQEITSSSDAFVTTCQCLLLKKSFALPYHVERINVGLRATGLPLRFHISLKLNFFSIQFKIQYTAQQLIVIKVACR